MERMSYLYSNYGIKFDFYSEPAEAVVAYVYYDTFLRGHLNGRFSFYCNGVKCHIENDKDY